MSLRPNLDNLLWKEQGFSAGKAASLANCVGIEAELEGSLPFENTQYWVSKPEGSLRGGIEFVLAKPTPYSQIPQAVTELYNHVTRPGYTVVDSIRCSTHVHVSVVDFSIREIYNVLAAYYLLEEVLIGTQPKDRNGNLFCLKMSNASLIMEGIYRSLKESLHFKYFRPFTSWKYSALNLGAVSRFASLEFRFLRMLYKPEELNPWVSLLYNLVHNARRIPPRDLFRVYDVMDTRDFIDSFCGEGTCSRLNLGTSESLNRKIYTNYDFVNGLIPYLETKKKFTMPPGYWVDDLLEANPVPAHNPFEVFLNETTDQF